MRSLTSLIISNVILTVVLTILYPSFSVFGGLAALQLKTSVYRALYNKPGSEILQHSNSVNGKRLCPGVCCKRRSSAELQLRQSEPQLYSPYLLLCIGQVTVQNPLDTMSHRAIEWIHEDIVKPDLNKHQQWRVVKLRNGMQVLIISDEKADQSAASMNVGIGKFQTTHQFYFLYAVYSCFIEQNLNLISLQTIITCKDIVARNKYPKFVADLETNY